ncbi:MAG: cobalt transporter [Clostridiales bacterium]|nr:cobalt transporter [Clostridiales bacterium]
MAHTHEHEHTHEHGHTHEVHSPEETVALLTYMVGHNQHHAEELHELAHSVEGEAQQLLHEAVVELTLGNEKLAEALRILKEEK